MELSIWTGDRRRIKPVKKVLPSVFFSDPLFFARRDVNGEIPSNPEPSMQMIEQIAARYDAVRILGDDRNDFDVGLDQLIITSNRIRTYNVTVILFTKKQSLADRTAFVQDMLVHEFEARIKSPRNPREMNYKNIGKFVQSAHITFALINDHAKLKIEVDKPLSFKELQEQRKQKAAW